MTERLRNLHLSDDELTLLFYMAGLSAERIPLTLKKTYDSLLKKLDEASRQE